MRRVSIVGIDFGARRIGVAVSESGFLATPLRVVRNEGDAVATLARIGEEVGAETFVVGIARRAHRSEPGERRFREFAERLRQRTCKEVVLWDEALSTVEAAERLRDAGRSRREAERDIDMHAAAVILQAFLDAQSRRTS